MAKKNAKNAKNSTPEAADKKEAGKKNVKTAAQKQAEASKPIPVFTDADGLLKKLKRSDFPTSREGKIAFCDYNIARWDVKKTAVIKGTDPLAKKKKRREKLLAALSQLDEEIGGDDEATEVIEA